MNLIVTTNPFGKLNNEPIKLLQDAETFNVNYNNLGRKYSREEVKLLLKEYNPEVIIAGTEKYDSEMLDLAPNLKMISRVGIGLDSIPLEECEKRNIYVSNTPDAPSNAVSEIVLGQMINLARRTYHCDKKMREKEWDRYIGKEIHDSTIGIIGCGRIGSLVYKKLKNFEPREIIVNDIIPKKAEYLSGKGNTSKEEILKKSDFLTIHIPYNKENHDFITKKDLQEMKADAAIINFSRGGIVNETDLYLWLKTNNDFKAAVDTFEEEPYTGRLLSLENCLVTPHLGSCSESSRYKMEKDSVLNVLKYFKLGEFNQENAK